MGGFKDQGLSQIRGSSSTEYVIGIMGRPQSGKSVFGDTFTERFELRGQDTLQTETKMVPMPSGDPIKLTFIEIPCLSSTPPPSRAQIKLIDEVLVDSYKQCQKFIGIVYLGDSRSMDEKGLKRDLEYVDAIIGSDFHARTMLVWNKTADTQIEARDIGLARQIWDKRFNPPTMEPLQNPDSPINAGEDPPRQGMPERIVNLFLEGDPNAIRAVLGHQEERTRKKPLKWGETKLYRLWESHQSFRGKMKRLF